MIIVSEVLDIQQKISPAREKHADFNLNQKIDGLSLVCAFGPYFSSNQNSLSSLFNVILEKKVDYCILGGPFIEEKTKINRTFDKEIQKVFDEIKEFSTKNNVQFFICPSKHDLTAQSIFPQPCLFPNQNYVPCSSLNFICNQ